AEKSLAAQPAPMIDYDASDSSRASMCEPPTREMVSLGSEPPPQSASGAVAAVLVVGLLFVVVMGLAYFIDVDWSPHRQPHQFNATGSWTTPSKDRLFRRAKKSHSRDDILAAKQLQREVKKQIRMAHRCFVEDITSRAVKEPNLFWAYVNSQRKQSKYPSFLLSGPAGVVYGGGPAGDCVVSCLDSTLRPEAALSLAGSGLVRAGRGLGRLPSGGDDALLFPLLGSPVWYSTCTTIKQIGTFQPIDKDDQALPIVTVEEQHRPVFSGSVTSTSAAAIKAPLHQFVYIGHGDTDRS
ncbi:hypothetical protein HPB47_000909, partial [Ixodes persulcatus]